MTNKLLEFQKRVQSITKDSENPFFKSKYFDINKLLEVIKPLLNELDLLILQPIITIEGKNNLFTRIYDGEKVIAESNIIMPENPDPQKTGAIISYFRRYAIQSLLALEAEDDDGNSVSGENSPVRYARPTARPMTGIGGTKGASVQYPEKMCPSCGIPHTGRYPKCINCYKSGNPLKATTKVSTDEEEIPFE